MLTERQVVLIEQVSKGVSFGLVMGAVCGLLVTAAMLVRQRRTSSGIEGITSLFSGLMPGAVAGAIVAAVLAAVTDLLEVMYGEPGPKGGHVLPNWLELLSFGAFAFFSLLAAAIAAMLAMPDVGARQPPRRTVQGRAIAWGASGAIIGAVAGVGWGFDGYFVLQSNAGPIRCAIAGATFLAIGSLLWRLFIGLPLSPSDFPESTQIGRGGASRVHSQRLLLLVCLYLFAVGICSFGTIGISLTLDAALWSVVVMAGRFNVRLAWLGFTVFCVFQPLIVASSREGWGLTIFATSDFPHFDTIHAALHVFSLAMCGPLVWAVVNMRWDEFNPTLYVCALPAVAVFQGSVVWWIGDLFLHKRGSRRRWLAALVLADTRPPRRTRAPRTADRAGVS